jgi:CubicO group peptidase (beta-lactamase class C family)
VARYWPEFAEGGKSEVTVRQILCHQAGLFDIRSMIDDAHVMLDWGKMTDALARAVPVHPPGAAMGYHGLTYGWLVGELAQRVTGKRFRDLLRDELAGPLGIEGLYCGLPEDRFDRRAYLVGQGIHVGGSQLVWAKRIAKALNHGFRWTRIAVDLRNIAHALMPAGMETFDFNADEVVSASIPSANGMFDARSLAKLYAVLANGGALGGVRLLSERGLRVATTVQSRARDVVVPFPMHWRLGYHRAPVAKRVPHAFGHAGYGGSGAWADPDRNLAVALVLNSGVGTPFGDLRIARVGTAALTCADAR